MTTIEGWPYAGDKRQGKDLQTRYTRTASALAKAEARMRRAFNAWEKARAAHARVCKALEKPAGECPVCGDPGCDGYHPGAAP
jgi:hypothetical protein